MTPQSFLKLAQEPAAWLILLFLLIEWFYYLLTKLKKKKKIIKVFSSYWMYRHIWRAFSICEEANCLWRLSSRPKKKSVNYRGRLLTYTHVIWCGSSNNHQEEWVHSQSDVPWKFRNTKRKFHNAIVRKSMICMPKYGPKYVWILDSYILGSIKPKLRNCSVYIRLQVSDSKVA